MNPGVTNDNYKKYVMEITCDQALFFPAPKKKTTAAYVGSHSNHTWFEFEAAIGDLMNDTQDFTTSSSNEV